MESNRLRRLPGLMRRTDRIGQAGRVGAKSIADATLNAAYRPSDGGAREEANAAERAHVRGAESLELVVVAGSLLESSKELLQLSHVQITQFMTRRAISADELARQAADRHSA